MRSTETSLEPRLRLTPAACAAGEGWLRQADLPTLPEVVAGHAFIYELIDPVTGQARYVGRTRAPRVRRTTHYVDRRAKTTAVAAWHRQLVAAGHRPVMRILEGPLPYDMAAAQEEHWRQTRLADGCALLNRVRCVDGRREGSPSWTADAARDRVRALATGLMTTRYPTIGQFASAGLSGLHTAIIRRLGGHRQLAADLGLGYPRSAWTRAEAGRAVLDLVERLGCPGRYPAPREFYAHELTGAFLAITHRFGGHRAFAEALGLIRPRVCGRSENDAARAVLAISATLGHADTYPTENEFVVSSEGALYTWIAHQAGGHRRLADQLGLKMTREPWTRERAADVVLALVDELDLGDVYPTLSQFDAAGLSGLRTAICERMSGHRRFADALSLRAPTRKVPIKWTEQLALHRTRTLAESEGHPTRYPTNREFNEAGLGGLEVAIRRRLGGHDALAKRAGMTTARRPTTPPGGAPTG